jgi:hypothetical protein
VKCAIIIAVLSLFVEVLKLARTMGMLKLGTVALDGTKVHANASRHSALSYGHAKKIEKQLKKEVQQLLRLAEQADGVNTPDGMSIPEELERRELRLAAISAAKAKIEARAAERLEREQADHQRKLAARAEQEKRTGKKPRGLAGKFCRWQLDGLAIRAIQCRMCRVCPSTESPCIQRFLYSPSLPSSALQLRVLRCYSHSPMGRVTEFAHPLSA